MKTDAKSNICRLHKILYWLFDFFDLAKIFEHIKANTAAEVKKLQSDIELLYIAKLENEIVALKEKNRELEQLLNAHIASQRTMNRDE